MASEYRDFEFQTTYYLPFLTDLTWYTDVWNGAPARVLIPDMYSALRVVVHVCHA